MAQWQRNFPANEGDTADEGLIPGSGRSPGEEKGNLISTPAWEIHGQRGLEGYSPWGLERVGSYLATKQPQLTLKVLR